MVTLNTSTEKITGKRKDISFITPTASPTIDELPTPDSVLSSGPGRAKIKTSRTHQDPTNVTDGNDDNTIVYLHDARDQAYKEAPWNAELDIVLLPPPNSHGGETDIEDGEEECIQPNYQDNVCDIAATLEVQSSHSWARSGKDKIYKKFPSNYKNLHKNEVKNIADSVSNNFLSQNLSYLNRYIYKAYYCECSKGREVLYFPGQVEQRRIKYLYIQ